MPVPCQPVHPNQEQACHGAGTRGRRRTRRPLPRPRGGGCTGGGPPVLHYMSEDSSNDKRVRDLVVRKQMHSIYRRFDSCSTNCCKTLQCHPFCLTSIASIGSAFVPCPADAMKQCMAPLTSSNFLMSPHRLPTQTQAQTVGNTKRFGYWPWKGIISSIERRVTSACNQSTPPPGVRTSRGRMTTMLCPSLW